MAKTSRSSSIALAATAVGVLTSASAGQQMPLMLDTFTPAKISQSLDLPDWVTYAKTEYDRLESLFHRLHPRFDTRSNNLQGVGSTTEDAAVGKLPELWELCERGDALRCEMMILSPTIQALQQTKHFDQIDEQSWALVSSNATGDIQLSIDVTSR